MKNIHSSQRVFMFAVLLALLVPICAFAQNNLEFKVGDQVEVYCDNCIGRPSGWTKGWVEAIENRGGWHYKVRYSNEQKYHFALVSTTGKKIRDPGRAAVESAAATIRLQFVKEAERYFRTVETVAFLYDPRFSQREGQGLGYDAQFWNPLLTDLEALDAVCRRFPGLTNKPNSDNPTILKLSDRQADWCGMAAQRKEMIAKGKLSVLSIYTRGYIEDIYAEMGRDRKGGEQRNVVDDRFIKDHIQLLLFDRAAWEKQERPKINEKWAKAGEQAPADVFAEVYAKADELKAHIDRLAPENVWKQPSYKDAAVEALIRNKFASEPEFKGTKVIKIGLDYTTWKKRESASLVGSDSNYKYYKVSYNFYKRGVALVKVPNRPLCQAREFVVGKGAKGISYVSLGGSGLFMKCQ